MQQDLLESTKISDLLIGERKLITIKSSSAITEALEVLSTNHIRIIPVLDEEEKFLGVLTTLDIAGYVIKFNPSELQKVLGNPVSEVLKLVKTETAIPMYTNYTMKVAVQALSGLAHAIPISDEHGKIIDLLTQSDVVKYIYEKNMRGYFGDKAGISVEKLGFAKGKDTIEKVDGDMSVANVLPLLFDRKFNALAIVDKTNGAIIGNFSATDLRTLNSNNLQTVFEPISKFANIDKQVIIKIDKHASLGTAIQTVCEKKIHRVWVVDNNIFGNHSNQSSSSSSSIPVGLVTLSDILRCLL